MAVGTLPTPACARIYMRVFILQGSEFVLLAKPIDRWRTLPPQLLDLQFQVGSQPPDHGESKHMKNSCSGAGFFTGAGIEPEIYGTSPTRYR